jgi:hypothetical protein
MDDSHPLASTLQMFFWDEPDDDVAIDALSQQLSRQPYLLRSLHRAWREVLEARDPEDARTLVEVFANRDVQGSGQRAYEWLATAYDRLQPLWAQVERD